MAVLQSVLLFSGVWRYYTIFPWIYCLWTYFIKRSGFSSLFHCCICEVVRLFLDRTRIVFRFHFSIKILNDIGLYCIIHYNKYLKSILNLKNQTITIIYVSIYSSSYFRFIWYNERLSLVFYVYMMISRIFKCIDMKVMLQREEEEYCLCEVRALIEPRIKIKLKFLKHKFQLFGAETSLKKV